MKFAYADPPYLGMCSRYGHEHGDGGCWDDIETHGLLIERLSAEFDGWALSLHVPSLRHILPLCPDDVRVMAWCKTWASWKPGVHPAAAWEPIILRGQRKKRGKRELTARDWFACPVETGRGFFGAKPAAMVTWLLHALGVQPDDEFVDLFHGSGAVTEAYERWRAQMPLSLDVA